MTREVHPVADLFPMLAADELAELAADIKARGQLQPIVLDPMGRVLDGRNRLAACELAEVEPIFTTYAGEDLEGYALAVNMARRNLTKGQMAAIATNPKSLVSKEWGSGARLSGVLGVSETLLSQARTVWKHAPDLGEQVVTGAAHLDEAYPVALSNKRIAKEREENLARITVADADLAVLVREKRLSIDDALATIEAREAKAREEAERQLREAEARASEYERARRIAEQEYQESLERDRERIRAVINGWASVQLVMRDPDSGRVIDIIAGLMPGDQKELQAITDEVKGVGE